MVVRTGIDPCIQFVIGTAILVVLEWLQPWGMQVVLELSLCGIICVRLRRSVRVYAETTIIMQERKKRVQNLKNNSMEISSRVTKTTSSMI